jgi:hypothetical protein
LLFVYQGMAHGLFTLLEPSGDETPIPGFTEVSWRTLIRNAEIAIEKGDLEHGYRRLVALREKYAGRREASEQLAALEKMIAVQLDRRRLSDSAVLELALPATDLTAQPFSPQEAFLLSRINGAYTLSEILQVLPGQALENRLMVDALVRREVIRLKEQPRKARAGQSKR